ncbi:MAG: hypothetical protein JW712_07280 [Dehalococcoidales bacterium]|nr:hypothetical protein [Dehalococcoidales bacterium]
MKISPAKISVLIDTGYAVFYNNELFNENSLWNRDNQLAHNVLLKQSLESKGISVNTSDCPGNQTDGKIYLYSSFGQLSNFKKISLRDDVYMQSFYIFEPPNVAPQQYSEIGNLTNYFDNTYVVNTEGTGYERSFSTEYKLCKLFNPQTRNNVIETLWNNQDRKFVSLINSNKLGPTNPKLVRRQTDDGFPYTLIKPYSKDRDLYGARIHALLEMQKLCEIDLYGYGWGISYLKALLNVLADQTFSYQYMKNYKKLLSAYKGTVSSKHETLSKYRFNICFENYSMPGWITEKIFDCFYVGTIPIYLGAPDIEDYIPDNCYIDLRNFKDYSDLYHYLTSLSENELMSYKKAGKDFLSSNKQIPFSKERFVEQFENDMIETLRRRGIELSGS